MKKLSNILISSSLLLFFLFLSIISKSQCVSSPLAAPAPNGSTVKSRNGYYAPTSGTYRALIIFAEVIYLPSSDDPNPSGNASWLPNSLPVWANDVFNLNVGSLPLKPMTRYFDQASFGQLHLLGDVLINPNNPTGIFRVPLTTAEALSGTHHYPQVFNEVNSSTVQRKRIEQNGIKY